MMRGKLLLLIAAGVLAVGVAPAFGAQPGPRWAMDTNVTPTAFSSKDNAKCLHGLEEVSHNPGNCDAYRVTAWNSGSRPADGSPITITDSLPPGVTVQQIQLWYERATEGHERNDIEELNRRFGVCSNATVTCSLSTEGLGLPAVGPDDLLEMVVFVTVGGASGGLTNTATISGGGVPEATTEARNAVSETPALFGTESFNALIAGVDGAPDTQAGDHPYEFTTTIDLHNQFRVTPEGFPNPETSIQDVKDVVVDLPLGFLGSVLATPQCTLVQLASEHHCPMDTTVGYLETKPQTPATEVFSPIYNIVPEHGVAAEFGFWDLLHGTHVLYSSVVPTASGYVLRTIAPDVPQVTLSRIEAIFYGNPAEANGTGNTPVALFTNPASCSGEPLRTKIHMDSWQAPGRFNPDGTPDFSDPRWVADVSESPPVTGCNVLRFEPSLSVQPETTAADSPTGLAVEMKIPQHEDPGTLATPPLRDAAVTLPAGLTVNPSAATGLAACSEAQIALGSPDPPTCPEASKIGTIEVTSPAVGTTLTGSIYLAAQNENPFHTLLAGYIVVDDPTTGVVVKIPGNLTPNPATGQITGKFDDNPQFPVSDLKLHFFGGARGELATPQSCGMFTTTSDLMPWSAPESGPDATPSDSFPISAGCANPFTPAFSAGNVNPQAGGYSPFTLSLGRSDGEQNLAGITVTLPSGLLGKIAGVPLCPDANATAGTCPESSMVGTVQTWTGVGPNPLLVSGKAYLTGPYNGGPYGLAVQVPAIAGPFNLGTVVVRQSLRIDPSTAQVTDVSDPFPTILDGIPLRIRRVSVTLNRPSFTFNPTSCATQAITGTVGSTAGTQTPVSSRFQAAGCQSLPFHPDLSASTDAHTSKTNGASLNVKIGFHSGDANIHKVELTIPNILPSRLTTLQKACTEAQFNTNPAGCPTASNIATAIAHTPLLPDPLAGPVYFVSHGGAAFPDTVMVLQGDNVKLVVVGHTDIKHGITYSRFETVPDAPVSSFEFKAPEGPYSIFGANDNLCSNQISMPTTITGQNGAVLKQNTVVEPEGCPDSLTILSHKIKGRAITLKIALPGPGKLTATGSHLTKATATAHARGTLTLTLKTKGHGKLNTKVKLTYTPTKGHKLTAAVAARFKK